MKYPNYDAYLVTFSKKTMDDPLAYYDVMVSCMDKLVSQETVYKFSDFSREEVEQFIESLNSDVIEKIQSFFDTMPKLRHELRYVNQNDVQKVFVLEGTDSFFM